MPHDQNNETPGLAGALTRLLAGDQVGGDHQTSPQVIADLARMEQLRLSLDRLADRLSKKPEHDDLLEITRANVIDLLICLHTSLSVSLLRRASDEEDLIAAFDHPAMVLLNEFIDTLKDLDNAKRHPIFKTPNTSKGASLTTTELSKRDALLELVDLVKLQEGFRSRAEAEEWLEQRMKKAVGRDAAITAQELRDMRKTRRRQQKRAS